MAVKRGGLGKGLDSLIPDHKTVKTTEKKKPEVEEKKEGEQLVNINKVEPNHEQPRRHFEEDSLLELADSIKQFGVLQLFKKEMTIMKLLQAKEDGEPQKWLE